ncbi:hypothetical protein CW306_08470 [Bacillus sp. BA3]|nr:hypothetical protein CW306_08470 [Bacillus sp. BA3]
MLLKTDRMESLHKLYMKTRGIIQKVQGAFVTVLRLSRPSYGFALTITIYQLLSKFTKKGFPLYGSIQYFKN